MEQEKDIKLKSEKREMLKKKDKTGKDRDSVIQEMEDFILEKDHPCLMAQSVFGCDNYRLECYSHFGSESAAEKLYADISGFVEKHDFQKNSLESFIAVFPGSPLFSEIEFEQALWDQLTELHKADKRKWDETVSPDPEENHFSFSVHGKAFYVIGMHPNSSRISRQSPHTALVFNLHHQFEHLRNRGVFDDIRDKIRNRDKALQGTLNPMLDDFGNKPEARQYSGRTVEDNWKCPFHKKNT